MNKLVKFMIILDCFLLIFFVLQCEKVTTQQECYFCTVTTTWRIDNITVTSEKDLPPYCGVDWEWIRNFETINTYSDTTNKMVQTCKCK